MTSFSNRHVIVTGGTGALGAAVVRRLVRDGARVSIPCFSEQELQRFDLKGNERVHATFPVDLANEKAVESFYTAAAAWGNGVWASIHIAGGFAMSPVLDTSFADYTSMMTMNAATCFLCCREALRIMTRSGSGVGGRIVNVAARPALEPRSGANMVAYTASKAAVAAMTQAIAEEAVPTGVLVNAVVPSIMDTPANRAAMPGADHAKWPKVDDIAETICFLASPLNTTSRRGLVPVYGRA